MEEYDISVIMRSDFHYCCTTCKLQHWNSDGFSYRSKARPDFGLLFVIKGHIRFDFKSGSLTANPGDLIFLPKGINYEACIPQEFGDTVDYLVNFEIVTPFEVSVPPKPVRVLHTDHCELPDYFERIITDFRSLQYTDLYITGCFYILLEKIHNELRIHSDKQKNLLQHAQELLTDRHDLSIADIAAYCNMSESCLRSQFKRAYGLSPKQYRMQMKINQAKYLLEATELSVYDISDRLEFYDEAYFCKIFRNYVGCSPKKYKQSRML